MLLLLEDVKVYKIESKHESIMFGSIQRILSEERRKTNTQGSIYWCTTVPLNDKSRSNLWTSYRPTNGFYYIWDSNRSETDKNYCGSIQARTDGSYSFVDLYKKTEHNFEKAEKQHRIKFIIPSQSEEIKIIRKIAMIAERYHITLNACAADHLTTVRNVNQAQCINIDLIHKITDVPLKNYTFQKSREGCHCLNAPDIGYYDSCPHGCIYCYSNKSPEIAWANAKLYRKMGFPLDDLETVAQLTSRVMCDTLTEYFPMLRPQVDVNIIHPQCWNKDGNISELEMSIYELEQIMTGQKVSDDNASAKIN